MIIIQLKKYYTSIKMIKLIKIIYFIFLSFYFLSFPTVNAQEKIKIGLLVPMTGENKEIGESIIKQLPLLLKILIII